jgi:PKD repeat protein
MYSLNQFVNNQFVTARHDGDTIPQLNGLYSTESALDTQLSNFDSTYYDADRLASLSMNDKIFAARIAQELEGGSGIQDPPIANFSSEATLLDVDFTDLSTSPNGLPLTEWGWIFGDGNTSAVQNPSNTYDSAGEYEVILTVKNSLGVAAQHQETITVSDV